LYIPAPPVVLGMVGFTKTGVVAGSIAASVQSAVYGGATMGVFSTFQSAGVLGVGLATKVLLGAASVVPFFR